ncbi:hypothetical protein ACJ73_03237 [Blastomyces percursus]|uniref:Uncharacterized protein n=1 Tax=Blastomyces percursus TaxID=1658174 RepID=A0A1J9Q9B7_9EURO|nr:hypothetical protein ACJ73_03237 [Blastomyces percursus]
MDHASQVDSVNPDSALEGWTMSMDGSMRGGADAASNRAKHTHYPPLVSALDTVNHKVTPTTAVNQ